MFESWVFIKTKYESRFESFENKRGTMFTFIITLKEIEESVLSLQYSQ